MTIDKYTTEQLLAYLQHLDRECFPANIAAIECELARRGVNPSMALGARIPHSARLSNVAQES